MWSVCEYVCACVCEYMCVGGREGLVLTSTLNDLEAVDGKQQADIPAQCATNYVAPDATYALDGCRTGSVKH